jgi:hypothetical protein
MYLSKILFPIKTDHRMTVHLCMDNSVFNELFSSSKKHENPSNLYILESGRQVRMYYMHLSISKSENCDLYPAP